MEGEKITCPKCGSNDYKFTEKTRVYICNNCDHEFTTVFISYGHDEYSDLAFKIEEDLLREGIIVWIDKKELHVGKDWELRIERGLLGTQIVISMLTPHSVGREDGFCRDEISYARALGRKIIPIMVREVIPPLSIHRIQWLDFQDWPDVSEETYKKKFGEIFDIVMGKLLSFDGRYSRLLDSLKPINFKIEIDRHVKNFYGREWIFKIISDWIKSERKVFLLTGNPGVGKTAISAMLCHKYSDSAVYHLVKSNDLRKASSLECVLSLAFQLATRLPKYAEKLIDIDLEGIRKKIPDEHDFEDTESYLQYLHDYANTVFDELIVQPLQDIPKPLNNILIIIDALDEATKAGKNELVSLIAEKFELTPLWLKLFITTRPIKSIVNKLAFFNPNHLKAEEERNLQDIQGYLEKSLDKIFPDSNNTEAVDVILKKSEGIFLYAQQVMKEIKDDKSKLENLEQFPKGLNAKYQMFFERQFANQENYNEYQRPLLSIVSAAYEPLDVELIKSILGDTNRKFKQRIEPMGLLLEIEDGFVKPFHASLIEWVTNEETEVDFYIDRNEGHNILADYGWKMYKLGVTDIPHYFLTYLPQHLLVFRKHRSKDLSDLLTNQRYLKTCYQVGLMYNLMKSLSDASDSQDMPVKRVLLLSRKGMSHLPDGTMDADVVAASTGGIMDLSERLIFNYHPLLNTESNSSEHKFSFAKSKNGSCFVFMSGVAKDRYYDEYRYHDEGEHCLAVAYDKQVSLKQILSNYFQEKFLEKEESLLVKFKEIKKYQEELRNQYGKCREVDEKKKKEETNRFLEEFSKAIKFNDEKSIETIEKMINENPILLDENYPTIYGIKKDNDKEKKKKKEEKRTKKEMKRREIRKEFEKLFNVGDELQIKSMLDKHPWLLDQLIKEVEVEMDSETMPNIPYKTLFYRLCINSQLNFISNYFNSIYHILLISRTGLHLAGGEKFWKPDGKIYPLEPVADVYSAGPATLQSLWEKVNKSLGFDDLEYILIISERYMIILMPLGQDFIINIAITDIAEFYRYSSEYIDIFKKLNNFLLFLMKSNKNECPECKFLCHKSWNTCPNCNRKTLFTRRN